MERDNHKAIPSLQFGVLRAANTARLPQFKNKFMIAAHSVPDGSDWAASDWLTAVVGELGEYANNLKKFRRGDLTLGEFRIVAGKELADIIIYLDLLAKRTLDLVIPLGLNESGDALFRHSAHPTGIDLGAAVVAKFNEVSERVDSTVRLEEDGSGWYYRNDEAATFPKAKKLDGSIAGIMNRRGPEVGRRMGNFAVTTDNRVITRRAGDREALARLGGDSEGGEV